MYIVITLPEFFDGEAERITLMMQAGLDRLHLRKPGSTPEQCAALLDAVPACYHSRIVLHDHFELARTYQVAGVHLNGRNPHIPEWLPSDAHVSRSCHSIDELAAMLKDPRYNYLSLSPIYDSISKKGYKSPFSTEELSQASASGIINERVVALGGICAENVAQTLSLGFGGVMVLGDAWKIPQSPLPIVLSIAGSDPSAGAGVQQDLKTMTSLGCYGTTVITSLTSQNTLGVKSTMPVPAEVVESQLRAVLSDLRVEAVKIGIIPDENVAKCIVKVLREERQKRVLPVVYDPVMVSTSGHQLMTDSCIGYVQEHLFPLCTLITPNLPEMEKLSNSPFPSSILIKGGHAEGEEMTDVLHLADEQREVSVTSPRITTTNLHGTGCTLSSAIACYLAKGYALEQAVGLAKKYIDKAIEGGKNLHIGHGNGPLWYNFAN